MIFFTTILVSFCLPCMSSFIPGKKPNIILIVADDMGFDDISFHGSDQIPTPNIDAILAFGISLGRYYTAPMCTPSRTSLMTGRYASNLGMQSYVIANPEPDGLDSKIKLLPEYLRDVGYVTHMIGKWHLGLYEQKLTPNRRGFDSFFGYLGGFIDYFDYKSASADDMIGFDFRRNYSVAYDASGYAPDLFARAAVDTIRHHNQDSPLFLYLPNLAPHSGNQGNNNPAPPEEIAKFAYIKNEQRRAYAAKVSILDRGVGEIVKSLKEEGMLENSVILFFSDNGSPVEGELFNYGSNYPFRGQKDTPWEGAVRTACGIWSPFLEHKQRVSQQLIHISDWFPTLAYIAGADVNQPTDSYNVWDALSLDLVSPRNEVLINADQTIPFRSYVRNQWKFIVGSTYNGSYDGWLSDNVIDNTERNDILTQYGETVLSSDAGQALSQYSVAGMTARQIENNRNLSKVTCKNVTFPSKPQFECNPLVGPCLFNILDDPCERYNLASIEKSVLEDMAKRSKVFYDIAVTPRNRLVDNRSNPKNFNGTWTWWYDVLGLENDPHYVSI